MAKSAAPSVPAHLDALDPTSQRHLPSTIFRLAAAYVVKRIER